MANRLFGGRTPAPLRLDLTVLSLVLAVLLIAAALVWMVVFAPPS
jgi:hypothetical protein